MRNLIIIFLAAISIPLTTIGQEDTIGWSFNGLRWEDYKTVLNPASAHDAFTYSGISFEMFEEEDTVHVVFTSYFDRSQSWVRKGHLNDTLLAHEQLHFDIMELYTRKMYAAAEPYTNKNYREFISQKYEDRVRKIFSDLYNEQIMRQQNYDVETAHGQIDEEQKKWTEAIHKELSDLKKYDVRSTSQQ
ncbi:MAG: hypothetical protein RL220_144 [Bacteroidota bacterium]